MKICRTLFLSALAGFTFPGTMAHSQQIADPNFDTKVARPAYTKKHPRILFDEGHNDFHTSTGGYKRLTQGNAYWTLNGLADGPKAHYQRLRAG